MKTPDFKPSLEPLESRESPSGGLLSLLSTTTTSGPLPTLPAGTPAAQAAPAVLLHKAEGARANSGVQVVDVGGNVSVGGVPHGGG